MSFRKIETVEQQGLYKQKTQKVEHLKNFRLSLTKLKKRPNLFFVACHFNEVVYNTEIIWGWH